MDPKLQKTIIAALDAGQAMFDEFYDPKLLRENQVGFYKQQIAKVKAARRAMQK